MEFRGYLQFLRSRWLTILLTIVVCGGGTLGYSLLQTKIYSSAATVFVSPNASNLSDQYASLLFQQGVVASYTALANTEAVANLAVDLADLPVSPAELASKITAQNTLGTSLITVSVSDPDPIRARDMTNAAANGLTQYITVYANPTVGESKMRAEVVRTAFASTIPVSPKTLSNTLRGLIVGIGLGVGGALLRDRLDSRIKDRKSLELVSGLPVVGELPHDAALAKDQHVVDFARVNSGSTEAYRMLRTNLQFLKIDHGLQVIVITSASPNEGKTTAAINLAVSLAESGAEVVLVEGDLRRPRIARYLGLVEGVGITTALAAHASLADVQQPTRFSTLSVIGSGPLPPNPTELLGSESFKKVIDELRSTFRYIVIDAPPSLFVSDAAVLGTVGDGMLFVVRHSKTRREHVRTALGNLNAVGANPLGVVLSMGPLAQEGAYTYYYYNDNDSATPRQVISPPVQPSHSRRASGKA